MAALRKLAKMKAAENDKPLQQQVSSTTTMGELSLVLSDFDALNQSGGLSRRSIVEMDVFILGQWMDVVSAPGAGVGLQSAEEYLAAKSVGSRNGHE